MQMFSSIDWGSTLTFGVTALITLELGYYAVKKRSEWLQAYRNISLPLMAVNFVMLIVAVAIILALFELNSTLFGFSWLNVFGDEGTNLYTSGSRIKYFGIIFCLLAMLALPYMAKYEEKTFREGTTDWKHGIHRSIWFGFIHMIVGVPLGAAIALIWLGLFYTACYFRGGLRLATQAHFQSNLLVFGLLLYSAINTVA